MNFSQRSELDFHGKTERDFIIRTKGIHYRWGIEVGGFENSQLNARNLINVNIIKLLCIKFDEFSSIPRLTANRIRNVVFACDIKHVSIHSHTYRYVWVFVWKDSYVEHAFQGIHIGHGNKSISGKINLWKIRLNSRILRERVQRVSFQ